MNTRLRPASPLHTCSKLSNTNQSQYGIYVSNRYVTHKASRHTQPVPLGRAFTSVE